MPELYTIDGGHLTIVRDGSVQLTEKAEAGAVGGGTLVLDDRAGTQSVVGQKDFAATQSLADPVDLFGGTVGDRQYRRGEETVGTAREIQVDFEDLNARLGFRLINAQNPNLTVTNGGRRPAETVAERGAWLMESPFLDGLVADNGLVNFPAGKGMDAADYRNRFPGDVLADMALASGGYNYFVYRDDATGEASLFFDDPNASEAYTSTVRISNVLADIDESTTFAPSVDFTLTRSPANVISKVAVAHSRGTVVRVRPETSTAFNGERAGIATTADINSAAKAADLGDAILWQRSTEEDVLDGYIEVPAANVNDVRAGQRMQLKLEHLGNTGGRDYDEWTWVRVLERTVQPLNAEGANYRLGLRLSPQEDAPPVAAIVQSLFAFYGTGGSGFPPYTHLPNPPTIGNSLLVAISKRDGEGSIDVPNPINPPNTQPDRPRWGAGAWTELPLDLGGFTETYVSHPGAVDHQSMTFYWKVVDSTNQDCAILNDYENVGVWELSGVDLSAATLVRVNNSGPSTTFDLGTLGTVATGELAFMFTQYVPAGDPSLPAITPASGWTTDHYRGNFPWWAGTTHPVVWMGHAIGTGATLDPALVISATARRFCGLAIKVPAA